MHTPFQKFKLPHSAWLEALTAGLCCIALGGAVMPTAARAADSAQSQVAGWVVSAKSTDPAFAVSAERGRVFYSKLSSHNPDMNSCAACHTANPAVTGKHVVTGKPIAPMSPLANAERFADAAKTEKWFKRNCNDVLGRACTFAEKADFVSFIQGVK